MIEYIVIAFVAGALTVLAPCILPLLPIVVGGSLTENKRWYKPLVVTGSLAVSVILFTLLLKLSTAWLGVPPQMWQVLSGLVIILLGISLTWPKVWEPLGAKLNLKSGALLGRAGKQKGVWGDILTGAALGPVFSSCSPTYAFIVAGVLPVSFGVGFVYLLAYALGLAGVLLFVALIGQQLIAKLQWASNPNGWFKRGIGVVFIIIGVFIATGLDHALQTFLVSQGWYDVLAKFEQTLMQ